MESQSENFNKVPFIYSPLFIAIYSHNKCIFILEWYPFYYCYYIALLTPQKI